MHTVNLQNELKRHQDQLTFSASLIRLPIVCCCKTSQPLWAQTTQVQILKCSLVRCKWCVHSPADAIAILSSLISLTLILGHYLMPDCPCLIVLFPRPMFPPQDHSWVQKFVLKATVAFGFQCICLCPQYARQTYADGKPTERAQASPARLTFSASLIRLPIVCYCKKVSLFAHKESKCRYWGVDVWDAGDVYTVQLMLLPFPHLISH